MAKYKRNTVKCAICGKSFVPYRSYQKYCSERCRLIQNGRVSHYDKNKVEERKCPVCGKYFKTNIKKKRYCSSFCYEEARKTKTYRAEASERVCPVCGKSFSTTHASKKYCCSECYREAQRKIKEEHRNE